MSGLCFKETKGASIVVYQIQSPPVTLTSQMVKGLLIQFLANVPTKTTEKVAHMWETQLELGTPGFGLAQP